MMKRIELSVADKTRTIGICPALPGIPPADAGLLAEIMQTEHLDAGGMLFEHGDPSDRIYVVAKGTLRVSLPGAGESARKLEAGDLFGEYGLFHGLLRTATVSAETESVLLSLDYGRFRAFLLRFPESALALLSTAIDRLVALEEKDRQAP